MLHYFPHAYPGWYIEGWAEYVSTIEFHGRSAHIGRPSRARSFWIASGDTTPILHLLAPERAVDREDAEFRAEFYATAWFAALYLANNDERRRGLDV
jgi:hypothetical protein